MPNFIIDNIVIITAKKKKLKKRGIYNIRKGDTGVIIGVLPDGEYLVRVTANDDYYDYSLPGRYLKYAGTIGAS